MSVLFADIFKKPTVKRGVVPKVRPWEVWCHCGDAFGLLAWSNDWRTAQEFAVKHAAEHEAQRCKTCGMLPDLTKGGQ